MRMKAPALQHLGEYTGPEQTITHSANRSMLRLTTHATWEAIAAAHVQKTRGHVMYEMRLFMHPSIKIISYLGLDAPFSTQLQQHGLEPTHDLQRNLRLVMH